MITHYKQLNGCEGLLNDFYSVCRDGLKEKLGPRLFQFPSPFTFTEQRLERVISGLDPAFVNVVEFRDPGWWNNKIYSRFRKHKLVFCGMSYPGLPAEAVSTHPTIYYRFHGIEQLYYSSYDEATLRETADSILNKRNVKEVYCYFNNTAAVGAIANAQWMEGYTTGIKQLHASK